MQAVGIVLLAFIASCFSQNAVLNNASMLTIGTTYQAYTIVEPSSNFYRTPQFFYVYIPMNTRNITITLANPPSTGCDSDLYLYVSSEGFYCGDYSPFDSDYGDFVCYQYGGYIASVNLESSTAGSSTYTITAGESYGDYGNIDKSLPLGGYLYFTTYRDESEDYNLACPYTLRVDASYCPSGMIASGSYSQSPVCVNYNNISVSATPQNFTVLNNGSIPSVYMMNLPEMVGHVSVAFLSNSTGLYVNGANRVSIDYDDGESLPAYNCYSSGVSYGNAYLYQFDCYSVQAGPFYITISQYSGSGSVYGVLQVSTQVCAANTVGPYCNSTYVNLTGLFTQRNTTYLQLTPSDVYGYVDVTPAIYNTYQYLMFYGNFSYDVYIVRGGFPYSDDTGIEYDLFDTTNPLVFAPTETGAYAPFFSNRFYFLFGACTTTASSSCLLTIINNATGGPTTTTASSMTTTAASVTGTTAPRMTTAATGTPMMTTAATGTTAPRMTTAATGTPMMTSGSTTRAATGSPVSTTASSALTFVPSILLIALIAAMF